MNAEFTVIETRTPERWESWTRRNVSLSDRGVELRRADRPTYVAPEPLETGDIDAIDVDSDRCDTPYLLGEDGELYRSRLRRSEFHRVPCSGTDDRRSRTGFCVTDETIYVVGSRSRSDTRAEATDAPETGPVTQDAPQRPSRPSNDRESGSDGDGTGYVQAISAPLWQTRWILKEFEGGRPFHDPIRVVTRGFGRDVYVLDRGRGEGRGVVVRVSDDGRTRRVAANLRRPVDLAVDERGDLYVLDTNEADRVVLRRYPSDTATLPSERDGRDETESGGDDGNADGDDGNRDDADEKGSRARTDESTASGRLCFLDDVVSLEAVQNGVLVIGLAPTASTEPALLRYDVNDGSLERSTEFTRSCVRLRRGSTEGRKTRTLLAIDGGTRRVWALDATRTVRRWKGAYAGRVTKRFDAGAIVPDWYQIELHLGAKPPGTRVVLHYATTAEACPDTYDLAWNAVSSADGRHALVPSDGNRFLWIRIDITGNQNASPAVESLRVAYSHDPYVQYLPSIYAADETDAEFLQRFLTVFESTFAKIDLEIGALTRYFDPKTVPADAVSWLGNWLAIAADDSWPEKSRRELIERAPDLFKRRGTRTGLVTLLDIYLGGVPAAHGRGTDSRSPDRTGPNAVGRRSTAADGGTTHRTREDSGNEPSGPDGERGHDHFVSLLEFGDIDGVDSNEATVPFERLLRCPQRFVVLLGPTVGDDDRETIERIVDSEKPVHAAGDVVSLGTYGRLGEHAYLGVNSRLEPRDFVVDESELGRDSALTERERRGQLDVKSRLGEDLDLS